MRTAAASSAFARLLVWCLALACLVIRRCDVQGGVLGLTKHFRTRYKKTWLPIDKSTPREFDVVCVDMNQILHTRLKTAAKTPVHFMASFFSQIDSLLRKVRPTKSLVLAFDGPAPFTKMQTQRSRRAALPQQSILTPGTDLMNAMEELMLCYVLQRVNRPDFKDVVVFISGASVPGEGELKLVEWINNHMPNHNESVVICGSDSDIFLQALCLAHVPNLMIMQGEAFESAAKGGYPEALCNVSMVMNELSKRPSSKQVTGLDSESDEGADEEEEEGEGAIAGITGGGGVPTIALMPPAPPEAPRLHDSPSLRFDMVMLFILQGNDYLPKLRTVSLSRAARAYDVAMQRLPPTQRGFLCAPEHATGTNFNFVALWTFLDELVRISGTGKVIHLPVQPPALMGSLQSMLQSKKLEANWCLFDNYDPSCIQEYSTADPLKNPKATPAEKKAAASRPPPMWGAELTLSPANSTSAASTAEGQSSGAPRAQAGAGSAPGQETVVFSTPAIHATKKAARQAAARDAIMSLDRPLYDKFIARQAKVASKLQVLREAVLAEQGADDEVAPGAADEGDEVVAQAVSDEEYSQYIRDSDVEAYLRGILWVVQMYVDGVCPDVGFSYAGHPPISPLLLRRYIEKTYLRFRAGAAAADAAIAGTEPVPPSDSSATVTLEDLLHPTTGLHAEGRAAAFLHTQVCTPRSHLRPLTAAATCVCVVPAAAERYVPSDLRGVWSRMQSDFFRQFDALTSLAERGRDEDVGGEGEGGDEGEGEGDDEDGDEAEVGGNASQKNGLRTTTYAALSESLLSAWREENGMQVAGGWRREQQEQVEDEDEKEKEEEEDQEDTPDVAASQGTRRDLRRAPNSDVDADEPEAHSLSATPGPVGSTEDEGEGSVSGMGIEVDSEGEGGTAGDAESADGTGGAAKRPKAAGQTKQTKFAAWRPPSKFRMPQGPFVRPTDPAWVVVTPSRTRGQASTNMTALGFTRHFTTRFFRLPLALPFQTMKYLPFGCRILSTPHSDNRTNNRRFGIHETRYHVGDGDAAAAASLIATAAAAVPIAGAALHNVTTSPSSKRRKAKGGTGADGEGGTGARSKRAPKLSSAPALASAVAVPNSAV